MIPPVSWFNALDHGVVRLDVDGPTGSWSRPSPSPLAPEPMLAIVGRPVKHFAKMTAETQSGLIASGLLLGALGWQGQMPSPEIGLMATGYDGSLKADFDYFHDYVASGRTIGRGSLFVYTLPTSLLGAISIGLSLTGPAMHMHHDSSSLLPLLAEARRMVLDAEAGAMLVLWSDPTSAVCFGVGPDSVRDGFSGAGGKGGLDREAFEAMLSRVSNPVELSRQLRQWL